VWKLIEHPPCVLWAGTNDGLERLDVAQRRIHPLRAPAEGRAGLSFRRRLVASPPPTRGKLWVGTFGGGLELFDPATGAFRAYPQDPLETGSPAASRILSLLVDHEGGVWVATFGGGLLRVPVSAMLLAEGAEGFSPPAGLEDRDVTAMASDRSGALWIGTRSGTLLRRDPVSTSYRRVDLGNPGRALRILADESDVVWVGTDRGVFAVRAEGRVVKRIDLGAGAVSALLRSRDGALWAGTSEGGLQQLDDDGHVRRRFLEGDDVTTIHESAGSTLWIGTRTGGLNVLDARTGQAVRLPPGSPGPSFDRPPQHQRHLRRPEGPAVVRHRGGRAQHRRGGRRLGARSFPPHHGRRWARRQQRHVDPRGRRRKPVARHQARTVALHSGIRSLHQLPRSGRPPVGGVRVSLRDPVARPSDLSGP
jgi:ligand-binding sensor domain-containing protein